MVNPSDDNTGNRGLSLVATILLGFAGGVIAVIVVPSLARIPELSREHPLLGAPFLTFLSIILIVGIFYNPLRTLLSRGALTIKWGDREISITDIESNIDTQFNDLESQLTVLADELDTLKQQRGPTAEDASDEGEPNQSDSSGILKAIRDEFLEVTSDQMASIVFHLGTSRYKWRNLATLAKRTGLDVGN